MLIHNCIKNCYRQLRRAYYRIRSKKSVWLTINREAIRFHRSTEWQITEIQKRAIAELTETGITILKFDELFRGLDFGIFSRLVEETIMTAKVQQRIVEIQQGKASAAKSYLIRMVGKDLDSIPVLDTNNPFLCVAVRRELISVISGYFEYVPRLVSLNLLYNVVRDASDSYSQLWHRDPEDRMQIKLFLYLRDVGQEDGPFCFIRGSHTDGPLGHILPQRIPESVYPPEESIRRLFPNDRVRICIGPAGTVVLCDTSGFHRGGNPRRNDRVLLTATYVSDASSIIGSKAYALKLKEPPEANLSDPISLYALGRLPIVGTNS